VARLEAEPVLRASITEIEMPLVPVLSRMERTGVRIDADELKAQSRDLGQRAAALEERAYASPGAFNLGSPKQIGAIFFDELEAAGGRPRRRRARRPRPRRCWSSSPRMATIRCPAHPGAPRPVQAALHLHRQAAGR
jgi:hypothetical protein